ncbi:hypothetical protein ASG90_13160 [Nocardioides sp. Soil797]|nr:hypothetical protein ASG90_13160 [Nocardioides sp. Soil797]
MSLSRSRARLKPLIAATAGLALGLSVLATQSPSASADPVDPSATNDQVVGADRTSQHTVTLITGDRAVVTYAKDGAPSGRLETDEAWTSRREGDALYLIPVSAQKLVDDGSLDAELFNVTGLVAAGYDDASRDDLPVIVDGTMPRTRGVAKGVTLDSIGATATTVEKSSTSVMFSAYTRSAANTTIWLDGHVEGFALDPATGVKQTGAPAAWAKGYDGRGTMVAVLDTGIDGEHPDLADRIETTRDFTGEGESETDVSDRQGHGTHVASTIAGNGTASAGTRRGMAPRADLVIGKVLGSGGGQASWIIAGMEWAVDQGADVVNMSLGSSEPTDCRDPIARSAQKLSKQTKTLFVVAAGNSGLRETVSSPACASGVLTVGAVDGESEVASFSSRGPGLSTHALKPDLTAPGVDIVGAANGSPGDNHYTTMSGTSMAAPHVAGGVALLRQAHPRWTAEQIRQVLTSRAKQSPHGTVYDSGTGEMSVKRALNAKVTATSGLLLGNFAWPHNGHEQATRKVTFTNLTKKKIDLKFKLDGRRGADGKKIPAATMQLGRKKATVRPGQTVKVPVTARDLRAGLTSASYGGLGARVLATNKKGKVLATSAVGYWMEPKSADLTVNLIDRDGKPATWGSLTVFQLDEIAAQAPAVDGEPITARLRTGKVSINGFVESESGEWTYLSVPELDLTKDRTITLDARQATPITVGTEQAAQPRDASMSYTRIARGGWVLGGAAYARGLDEGEVEMSALTTSAKVTNGKAGFGSYWRLYDPATSTAESDFVYNLAFDETGGVAADQAHEVADADLGSVDETWWAMGEDHTFFDSMQTVNPLTGELQYAGGGGNAVNAPGTRTAWYTAGRPWRQMGTSRRLFTEVMYGAQETFTPGEHRTTDWYRLPTATGLNRNADGTPGRVAERQGNLLGLAFPHWKDSEGRFGQGGFGDIGSAELFRGDESLGRSAWPSGQWEVPAGKDRYTAVVDQRSIRPEPFWSLGLHTVTRFGFTSSRPTGEDVVPLPIMLPTFDAEVDGHQLAPAEADFPVTIDFAGQDGYQPKGIGDVEVQVSYDEMAVDQDPSSYTWTDVEVTEQDGAWVAQLDNTDASGKRVSLHVSARAADGTTVDQYATYVLAVE